MSGMPSRSEMMRASSWPLGAAFCGRGTQISPLQAPSGFSAHPVRASNAFGSISSDVRIIEILLKPLIGDQGVGGQDRRGTTPPIFWCETELDLGHVNLAGG